MADPTYVFVGPVTMKDTFDAKYKPILTKRVSEALAKAIDRSSKLTTDAPGGKKDAEGLYIDGYLSLKRTDKGVTAELKMNLASWPKKVAFAFATSKSSTDVANPAKIDKDVDAIIADILKDVEAKVLKELEKKAP
jgi:hypothetical protein